MAWTRKTNLFPLLLPHLPAAPTGRSPWSRSDVGDGVVLHHVSLDVVVQLLLLILLLYYRLSNLLPGHHHRPVSGPGAVDGDEVRAAPPCSHAS